MEGMRFHAAYPLVVCAALAFAAPPAPALADACDDFTKAAMAAGLHEEPYWKTLLHFREGWFSPARSLVDDPAFFLSPEGGDDPRAEMAADLSALCAPPVAPGPAEEGKHRDRDPRCRFPARYAWLKDKLEIPEAMFEAQCPDRDQAWAKMKPAGATLVFPASHPNGPASMFGHTLVRLDHSSGSPLLSYSMNYAAQTNPDDNAIAYAMKGLIGLYPGFHTFLPYYQKVQQYSDSEQRDVWEYRLNLTGAETERLAQHAWELRDVFTDYYYMDENCSYNILFLLEAARESVSLTEGFGAWVTPIDTIRAVIGQGLVEQVEYRPSQAKKVRLLGRELNGGQVEAALAIGHGEASAEVISGEKWSDEAKARVLDIGAEIAQMDFQNGDMDKEEYQRVFLGALGPRSKFPGVETPDFLTEIAAPPSPESGHRSARVGLSAGSDSAGFYTGLSLKPAYHDLKDADRGFVMGSEIDFTEVLVAARPEGKVEVKSFDLLSITSLSPRDRFFKPLSWKVRIGADKRTFEGDRRGRVAFVNVGGGATWGTMGKFLCYALLETEAAFSPRVEKGAGVSAGPTAGALLAPFGRWKMGGELSYSASATPGPGIGWEGELWQTYAPQRDTSFQASWKRRRWADGYETELSLSLNYHF